MNNLDATAGTLTASPIAENQLLKETVESSIKKYFAKLGGALTNDLYELVLAEVEEPLLRGVMAYTRGNQSKAAILLGLSRGTLRKKLKIYGFID